MPNLIVVNSPADWPQEIPGAEVVPARAYLADPRYSQLRGARIYNLCRSFRYQSIGYYVSLLATARGHKALPGIATIQDMKSPALMRFVTEDLDELIQKSLAPIQSREFVLSIYFGRNLARRYDRLCRNLFSLFPTPLLRALFVHTGHKWTLQNMSPVALSEIPPEHGAFLVEAATEYLAGRRPNAAKKAPARYDMAILIRPDEKHAPSNPRALQKFVKAAQSLGFGTEFITKDDYGRLAEFDALFIRETTAVNHHTYRFARRAATEGLVVIDDPDSILKCTNKVYLAELMEHHGIATPRTLIVHRDNTESVGRSLGFPCVLKQPDSAFSQGVVKVSDEGELAGQLGTLLERSDLVVAQEYVPTDFDWRIGILDGKPLFACKYFMARKHWQIIRRDHDGLRDEGKVETFPVGLAPRQVVRTALKAANLVGDGLYGVDIKQVGNTCYVIEINDNPSIESGFEDAVLKDELYQRVVEVFLRRLEQRRAAGG